MNVLGARELRWRPHGLLAVRAPGPAPAPAPLASATPAALETWGVLTRLGSRSALFCTNEPSCHCSSNCCEFSKTAPRPGFSSQLLRCPERPGDRREDGWKHLRAPEALTGRQPEDTPGGCQLRTDHTGNVEETGFRFMKKVNTTRVPKGA